MSIDVPTTDQKIAELKQRLRTVTIDEAVYFVAEGDLLLEEEQLADYAARVPDPEDADATEQQRLLGMLEGGRILRWKPGLELSYRVLKGSFTQEEYETVRRNMRQATADWESTCGVKFRYHPELDEAQAGKGALFTVRKVNAQGSFIAAAFFPHDPTDRRFVNIDPSYFAPDLGFNVVGVLRHELGHVLGFRHEHIRSGAPAVCPKESQKSTIDLSKYDPRSVMHYFCGEVGSDTLAITETDKVGAQRVYGPPLSSFRFVE